MKILRRGLGCGCLPLILLVVLVWGVWTFVVQGGPSPDRWDLRYTVDSVPCNQAVKASNSLTRAIAAAEKANPDYSGIEKLGFKAPTTQDEAAKLRQALDTRRSQLSAKANSASEGACVNKPTAKVVDTDGSNKTLPMVLGTDKDTPISGLGSNQDERTHPVTLGTSDDNVRTPSWTALDAAYGKQSWYTTCADDNLGISWKNDVPNYTNVEAGGTEPRFILAVNTNVSDAKIRKLAAADGNRNVDKLPIVRTPSIINTRNLDNEQCSPFVDARRMVRVSIGKVKLDNGKVVGIETKSGIFVDCHNMWRIPPKPPVQSPPPGTPSTPSTPTKPPTTCMPPNSGTPPKCLAPKDPSQGPVPQGNVPTSVQGKNPKAPDSAEPKPSKPPKKYTPPPAPKPDPKPTPRPTPPPPPEDPAPQPSDPATGCVPPPGMDSC